MKFRILPLVFLCITVWTCNLIEGKPSDKKPTKKVTYSYACVDSTIGGNDISKAVSKTTNIIRNIALKDEPITDEVQNEYGDSFHKDAIETKTFVLLNDAVINLQLKEIMNNLLRARENPSGIKYSIHLLNDTIVNAFTFGGYIYITKGMYDKCAGKPDLLYFIIGHEIGHSEKGHIKKTIQELKLSEKLFGEEHGLTLFQIQKLITASFNQKNELEADYYGTDLTYQLNKDLCLPVQFWKEMSKAENHYNKLEDFFRTHPFSALRAVCLKDHILNNFGKKCTE